MKYRIAFVQIFFALQLLGRYESDTAFEKYRSCVHDMYSRYNASDEDVKTGLAIFCLGESLKNPLFAQRVSQHERIYYSFDSKQVFFETNYRAALKHFENFSLSERQENRLLAIAGIDKKKWQEALGRVRMEVQSKDREEAQKLQLKNAHKKLQNRVIIIMNSVGVLGAVALAVGYILPNS